MFNFQRQVELPSKRWCRFDKSKMLIGSSRKNRSTCCRFWPQSNDNPFDSVQLLATSRMSQVEDGQQVVCCCRHVASGNGP